MNFLESIWLIPLFPATGALLMLLLGRKLPKAAVSLLCPGLVLVSFLFSLGAVIQLAGLAEPRYEKILYTWLPGASFLMANGQMSQIQADWGFLLDPLSAVMILVVTGVGFLIHVYSVGYMAQEGGYYRFFGYMNLFLFFMLMLVLANNYLLLFVGWEGVGLCSYLLIGFYFIKKSASDAGNKAFLVNRIGDAGFVLGMLLMLQTFGSLRFTTVLEQAAGGSFSIGNPVITIITLLLFVGACGKSAQVPLYVWLPDAMEGPTPVSALIHAATMVTAGVYMIVRSNALYILSPETMAVVAGVGAFTAIFAATIGIAQNDIKRVLAYSTVSQLGYMVMACGVGAFGAGIFHLSTHAYFKALLFLGAGSVIHALSGEQDMRKMGGLKDKIPITYATFMVASLAIIGLPPFAGFFSKDEILWRAFTTSVGAGWLLWLVGFITAGLTAFYIWRLVFLTFFGESRVDHEVAHHIHESPKVMTIPLMILAALSLIGGWIGWPQALGGSNRFEHWLEPVFEPAHRILEAQAAHAAEHSASQEYLLMMLSVTIAGFGLWLAYYFFLRNRQASERVAQNFSGTHRLLQNKYYVDEVYNAVFVDGLAKGGGEALGRFDATVIDGGVNGSAWLTRFSSNISIWWDTWVIDGAVRAGSFGVRVLSYPVRLLQTGLVQSYALFIVVGVLIFLSYYLLR
ncbi:MAG: NADH dehydrogenase [Acidobacteria bacterium RIFCSPLOWO2_12_FULL_59_11]|nr:MAG: NADH dehydrogenase [Acidobacteria bacterium RIFCSPLOWO2_12_FULL_59_11]